MITVPDGTFNSTTNVGSVGGGLLTASASNVQIGSSGPWVANYISVAGTLAPPTLAISDTTNTATISGIAGINALGLINNGGDFSTTLTSAGSGANYAYANYISYTLTATVSASTALTLGALTTDGVGIALTSGSTVLSSTTTASPSLITLTPLGSNQYSLSLTYNTPGTGGPTGAIGIQLYDLPSGLLTANLLQSVSFSNVTLSEVSTPEPAAILLSSAGLIAVGCLRRRKLKARLQN